MNLRPTLVKQENSAIPNRGEDYSEEYFDPFRPARGIVRGLILGFAFWIAAIYFGWSFIMRFITWMWEL